MQALRRSSLAAAMSARFAPLGDARGAGEGAPPRDVAGHQINRMVKRGALWAFGSQIGGQVIRFASVIVLARLLTPDDYGAASIAVSLATFSVIVGDLGYGTALVQSKEATQRDASTAYWSALAAGTLCVAVAALGAYP